MILPIIQDITSGNGLDVVKVKELLRKNLAIYDEWAPEIDRMVRWASGEWDPASDVVLCRKPFSDLVCFSQSCSAQLSLHRLTWRRQFLSVKYLSTLIGLRIFRRRASSMIKFTTGHSYLLIQTSPIS